jgi:hypothetical protein
VLSFAHVFRLKFYVCLVYDLVILIRL